MSGGVCKLAYINAARGRLRYATLLAKRVHLDDSEHMRYILYIPVRVLPYRGRHLRVACLGHAHSSTWHLTRYSVPDEHDTLESDSSTSDTLYQSQKLLARTSDT